MSGTTTLRLSVLDQSPVGTGQTPADALAATAALAQEADELGYHRFWVAEHHDTEGFAGTAPEVLVGMLLERTRNLRIGSGGVLLPRYPARKVAETFRVLSALHPGRVDLGIGRAGGPARDFPDRVRELLRHLAPQPGDPASTPPPASPPAPPVWLLGAGTQSARLAAELGTSFAFAHFFSPDHGPIAFARFAEGPTGRASEHRALAVRVIAADTTRDADALADAYLLWRSRKDLGHDEPHPTTTHAARHRWTTDESARAAANRAALMHGTADDVGPRLLELARVHGVDELIVNTLTHDPEARAHSYRLLAKALL
ncbi:MsnO8 family LLM class oxidoreductase [Yinghuangia soli]|uniref:MsnO8 family LLM class oxidoreductase n=1 Tax=Yinghuangia soli TaxID=2908204 RepID=A0AA41Q492_9ACTN|nr:MsnO8 family LLM class oxidoreductase [Yinghuangia soli]MCF2529827.1 MsnO8 family LLM class oxidoreductase [Yinghuangia soli]